MTEPSQYWRPSEDKVLRELHATGLSMTKIAAKMGRAQSTVGDHGQALGLSWDRSALKVATAALLVDNRTRRSALEARFLTETETILDKLSRPMTVWSVTKGSEQVELSPAGTRDLMNAATLSLTHSLKIAVHDSDSSHDDAKSMLTGLASAMGMAFREGEAVL